jgi:hypothetical protein
MNRAKASRFASASGYMSFIPPELLGRPHEARGDARPRGMTAIHAGVTQREDRTRLTNPATTPGESRACLFSTLLERFVHLFQRAGLEAEVVAQLSDVHDRVNTERQLDPPVLELPVVVRDLENHVGSL